MSEYEKAWPVIHSHEGSRFTNHGWDPGGATKFGITLRWAQEHHLDIDHDGDVDVLDLQGMKLEDAKAAYKRHLWDHFGYGRVVDQQVATKVMDLSVNMGPTRAHRYVQRALNLCGYTLKEDGILGNRTLQALNEAANTDARAVLLELAFLQSAHYRRWVDSKEGREVARNGLLRRAAWPYVGTAV